MNLKDYYTILELPPSASPDDVKRAYRRLAQVYHPDKSGDDAYAKAQFTAIKEAYETLSNPQRKDEYLQARWYARSQGFPETTTAVSPVSFLQQLLLKERAVHMLDSYRSNYSPLVEELTEFFSEENIQIVLTLGDEPIKREIVASSMRLAENIPHPDVVPFLDRIHQLDPDDTWKKDIDQLAARSRRTAATNRYMPWIVAIIALLLCALIFLAA